MTHPLSRRLAAAVRLLRGGESPRPLTEEVPAISPEAVAEARRFFPLEKFFIFGHARSGTTMLARLTRLHPEVYCNYQAHFFTRPPLLEALVADAEVRGWLKRGSNRWNRGEDLAPVVLRAAADYILERDARREGVRFTGDKSPSSLLDGEAVRKMHKVYPDGYLIYILRDGRDTVLSHRFQAFIEFPERLCKEDQRIRGELARQPETYLSGQRSIFTPAGLRRAAEGWVRNLTQTTTLGKSLYGARFLTLRYEDLLERPWLEMIRVWDFLGAGPAGAEVEAALQAELSSNPDADWQQHKAGDLAALLQKGKRGSWRQIFTPADRRAFGEIADATLLDWGYEATR